MAKPTLKNKPATKTTKTVSAPVETPVATRKASNRETVLVSYTPSELIDLIGKDTPVQVGRKSLAAIQRAAVLKAAGL